MKSIKVSELTGAALDWAAAKCEGHESRCPWLLEKEGYAAWQSYENAWGNPLPNYSTDWKQGGPIIEREGISIAKLEETLPDAMAPHPACWSGHIDGVFVRYGPAPLIAAMRCYVAFKMGDTIEVPEELL
jgi:hypothetical protein